MSEVASMDRLQPCLLDRLTDDEPGINQESRNSRIISMRRYKMAVLRDLENLLNTKSHPPDDDIYGYPEVAKSVLNYGVRDMCGVTVSALKPSEIESQVHRAISNFESRILSNSLSVHMISLEEKDVNRSIALEIEGELWAQPMSDRLFVKTEIDVDTGHYSFRDRING